MMKYKVSCV